MNIFLLGKYIIPLYCTSKNSGRGHYLADSSLMPEYRLENKVNNLITQKIPLTLRNIVSMWVLRGFLQALCSFSRTQAHLTVQLCKSKGTKISDKS